MLKRNDTDYVKRVSAEIFYNVSKFNRYLYNLRNDGKTRPISMSVRTMHVLVVAANFGQVSSGSTMHAARTSFAVVFLLPRLRV